MSAAEQRRIHGLIRLLLGWFQRHARDLPWRRTLDPYAVWISEIMLQQTQVKTVIPYWERWMQALPNVRALAAARPDQVLKLWEGLGYYSRARNLQKAAQQIVSRHQGRFPEQFDDILALPGIGRYTAGAIASIAYNQPKPILDGNVIRVLARLFGLSADPREKRGNQQFWSRAEGLVEQVGRAMSSVGEAPSLLGRQVGVHSLLNQSLMELGALICTPRQPRCEACPLRRPCVARREDRIAALPNLRPRPAASARQFVAFVLKRRDQFLIRRRPAGVVNAHLWEFPNLEVTDGRMALAEAAREVLGMPPTLLTPLATVRHSITRYRILLKAFSTETKARPAKAGDWLTRREMERLAFTSAHRRILKLLA